MVSSRDRKFQEREETGRADWVKDVLEGKGAPASLC